MEGCIPHADKFKKICHLNFLKNNSPWISEVKQNSLLAKGLLLAHTAKADKDIAWENGQRTGIWPSDSLSHAHPAARATAGPSWATARQVTVGELTPPLGWTERGRFIKECTDDPGNEKTWEAAARD